MTDVFPRLTTLTLCLFLSCTLCTSAQSPAAAQPIGNADIIKLIQAGLPESAIINKIQANPGAFDTSTDALIALKKAGATDAELAVITAAPPAPAPAPMPVMMAPAAPTPPVEIFGGQILRTKSGDPYIQFPAAKQDVFPDGHLTNTASLVIYQDKPAILIPSIDFLGGAFGNVLFMKDQAIFDWYMNSGSTPREMALNSNYLSKQEREKVISDPSFFPQKKLSIFPVDLPLVFKRPCVCYGSGMGWTPSQKVPGAFQMHSFRLGIFDDSGNALFASAQLQLFVQDLQKDFDKVLARFESAAGITDIPTQLSPRAHYVAISEDQSQRYVVLYKQRIAEQNAKQGGTSWLATLNQLNDAVSLGSGVKSMGAGLANGSGAQMAAGLQTTTASANAMAATGTQAQYAANAQMQASLAQSNAAYAQNAAASQYAAPSTAAVASGSVSGAGSPVSSAGTQGRSVVLANGALVPTGGTATFSFTIVEGPLQIVSSPAGISCPGTCSHTFPAGYGTSVTFYITWQPGWFVTPENGSYLACGNGASAGSTGAATKNPPGGTLICTIQTNTSGNSTTNETLWVHKYGELWPGDPTPAAITTPSTPSSPYTLPKKP